MQIEAHSGSVNDLAFSYPNKQICIVTCGDDRLIKVWYVMCFDSDCKGWTSSPLPSLFSVDCLWALYFCDVDQLFLVCRYGMRCQGLSNIHLRAMRHQSIQYVHITKKIFRLTMLLLFITGKLIVTCLIISSFSLSGTSSSFIYGLKTQVFWSWYAQQH